jgi:phosphatidylserine decarboxylase
MRLLPHGAFSAFYGWLQRRPSSRARIPGFVESLHIDAAEAEHPVEQYGSLDDFFCRRLKRSARPIDPTPSRMVMPADGRTLVVPSIEGERFSIKGQEVGLAELLSDSAEAEYYECGSALVVRLAPCDYHRFHFPDSGEASQVRRVGGRLHSVHPIALLGGAPSFRNRRDITRLDSDHFGPIAMVEVGALAVGTIVQTFRPGTVTRGQEKGYFRFGGSTVVVLITADRLRLDGDLVDASARGIETFVKVGTSIGGF